MSKLGRQSVLGEASTGYNFDHMYVKKAEGYYGVGKIIDYFLLRLPAVKATQSRKQNILRIVGEKIRQRKNEGKTMRIIDVACGAGRYLAELEAIFNQDGIEIIGVDYDNKSLELGRSIAKAYEISETRLRFFKGNVFRLGHLKKFGNKIDWRPHIIIASGLIEYLEDDKVRDAFRQIYEGLDDEGLFLFVNQQNNPSKKLMEKVCTTREGAWILHYRLPNILQTWLIAAGFKNININTDQWGMYNLFTVRK